MLKAEIQLIVLEQLKSYIRRPANLSRFADALVKEVDRVENRAPTYREDRWMAQEIAFWEQKIMNRIWTIEDKLED